MLTYKLKRLRYRYKISYTPILIIVYFANRLIQKKTFCLQINNNFIILGDTVLSNEKKYATYFSSHVNL